VSDPRGAYSAEQVAGLLGLTLAQIRGYVRAGVIAPARGPRGEWCFSFQDLVFLRVVKGLATSRVPPRRVRQALRRLRDQLPEGRPLSGVRLGALGGDVVVRERDRVWSPATGQYWLDFEAAAPGEPGAALALPGRAAALAEAEAPVALTASADGWYAIGSELEDADAEQARSAYQRALALDPDHADAHVNLGCLEHEAGRLELAERHYRAALAVRPDDATAAFDLGVVLEDLGRLDEALAAYEQSLAAAPGAADVHYNLARLHDRRGDTAAAIRHLRAYRSLSEH
jgi:tetratricopeptide (TPR) repeat protein